MDIPDLPLPSWEEIANRPYDAWDREHIVVDTAHRAVEPCVREIRERLPTTGSDPSPR